MYTNLWKKDIIICRLRHLKSTMFATLLFSITGRYHCLFKQDFDLLRKVMEYENQWCLGLFLVERKRHREKLLKNTTTQAHPQRTITTFFSPITPTNATSNQGIHKWLHSFFLVHHAFIQNQISTMDHVVSIISKAVVKLICHIK